MDAPPLPDDPRDWPADPFALLGVPRSVSESDLKRAYTRLIRKYKPEHAPEEFRRIREAYETAIEMSRWYRDSPAHDPVAGLPFVPPRPAPDPAPSEPANAPAHETHIDAPVRPPAARPRIDPVEAAWADAGAGDFAAAYAALVALEREGSNRPDVPLRLYWLLALRPALDADRTRHDWLAAALLRSGLSGAAVELYQRELVADPNALYGPYSALLESAAAHGSQLLAVAASRLDACSAHERWAKIDLDLEALTRRARELDEPLWLDHIGNVIARTACLQPGIAQRCAALLADLKHLELRHSEAFDRIDYHRTFADLWRRSNTVPEPIRRAVALGWGGAAWRAPLRAVADWVAAAPLDALHKCDRVSGEETVILSAFARLLEARRSEALPESEFPPELIRGLVHARLAGPLRFGYGQARTEVLQFLLAERIDPAELVAVCAVDRAPLVRSLSEYVREDRALQLVCRAATVRCDG
ncbi:MAG TPA: J domain-containing protein [Gemmata sp.]